MNEAVPERVAAWLERRCALRRGEPIVVGCSGGGDSSALLIALAELGLGPLTAVYVDHGLREGTALEADRVAALAARCGAGSERVAAAVERRGNLLARAREARYRALAAAARRHGARLLAVGHTATDQAETILWRAQRGDPGPALAGIPPVRLIDLGIALVRPLAEVTREEAAAYARSRGADPVEDPTNARPELQRTRARALLARSTGLRDALVALGARASDLAAEIARRAEALGPLDRLDAAAVAALDRHVAAALLRRAGLHRAGRAHARALLALAADRAGTRSIDLGSGLVAERRYQILRIGERTEAEPWEEIAPAGPGTYRLGPWLVELDGTGEELVLRFPRPGDFARTWSGRRKLSDLLIDAKVARPERARIALAARGAEVVAIAHPALSRRLADSPSPRQAIRFSRITVGETGPEWRLTPG